MAGKRHTAREMALQMLYQHDMGGADLPQVFRSFDLSEFLVREGKAFADRQKPHGTGPKDDGKSNGAASKAGGKPTAGAVSKAAVDSEAGVESKAGQKARRRVHQAFDRARELVEGTARHREEIDELIRGQADNWRLERMPVVDRNVLRLAIYEMQHEPDVPKLVVLDEAIELAKRYGSDQSGRFINGLLDGLLKQRAFPGSMT